MLYSVIKYAREVRIFVFPIGDDEVAAVGHVRESPV